MASSQEGIILMYKHIFFQGINSWRLNLSRTCPVFRVVQMQDFILQYPHLCMGKCDWKQKFIFLHLWLDQHLTWHFKYCYLKYLVKTSSWTKPPPPLQKQQTRCVLESFRGKSKFMSERWTRSSFDGLQKLPDSFQHREFHRHQIQEQPAQIFYFLEVLINLTPLASCLDKTIATHNFFRTGNWWCC